MPDRSDERIWRVFLYPIQLNPIPGVLPKRNSRGFPGTICFILYFKPSGEPAAETLSVLNEKLWTFNVVNIIGNKQIINPIKKRILFTSLTLFIKSVVLFNKSGTNIKELMIMMIIAGIAKKVATRLIDSINP